MIRRELSQLEVPDCRDNMALEVSAVTLESPLSSFPRGHERCEVVEVLVDELGQRDLRDWCDLASAALRQELVALPLRHERTWWRSGRSHALLRCPREGAFGHM